MDVFGTVLGAIDLVGKLIGYLQAVKGAREDRQKLLSEVSALGALLEVLRGRLSHEASVNDDGDSISDLLVKAGINRPLQMCCDALNPIVDMLRRILSDTNTGTSTLAGKMRDLRWPFLREEIKMVLGNIERLKSLVSLALQTSLMEFIEKARDELAAVGLTIEEIKSVVSSLEAGQRAHTKRIELVQDDLTSLGAVLQGTANGIAEIRNTIDRNQEGEIISIQCHPLTFSHQGTNARASSDGFPRRILTRSTPPYLISMHSELGNGSLGTRSSWLGDRASTVCSGALEIRESESPLWHQL
ncbi:hypothetical protein BD779DRAFT_1651613 [Infundibulicybe gibba]|nr:hypothetical protein BD779DRAFT_1651613 [Infundibulicybe gibba]